MIANHYDVLGIGHDAAPSAIRDAYRERARLYHPDRAGTSASAAGAMAEVNEAYRVLSDPGRRAEYDRSLTVEDSTTPGTETEFDEQVFVPDPVQEHHTRLSPPGPARMPWKQMLIVAAIGSAVILFAAAFNDPPSEEVPDGILRIGSCVSVEANNDVREISCTGVDDLVVQLVIPIDARCPAGTLGYRDRLGLGTACLEI